MENNTVWGQGNTAVDIGAFPGTYEVINNTIAYNMWDSTFSVRNYAVVAAWPDNYSGISASIDLNMTNNIFAFNSNNTMSGPTGLYLGKGVTLTSEGNNVYWSRSDGEIQADFLDPARDFMHETRQTLRERLPGERSAVLLEVIRLRIGHLLKRRSTILEETLGFWNRVAAETERT